MHLRPATLNDLPGLLEIHNHAVRHLTAAWSEREDTLEERQAWLEGRWRDGFPVIVATDDSDEVIGFGSYGWFRSRSGYRKTIEHSIYVKAEGQEKGIGKALMLALIERARRDGYHVMVGAVDADNEASLAFHQRLGFETSCKLPQVGTKFGRWLDLYLVTLILKDEDAPASERFG